MHAAAKAKLDEARERAQALLTLPPPEDGSTPESDKQEKLAVLNIGFLLFEALLEQIAAVRPPPPEGR